MRKLAKLSLVAAVAVAGLTNVNAASLEEAIKGVDVSGQFRYRYQDRSGNALNATDSDNGTDVEIEVGVKVPVTENVTAVFKIDNANDDKDNSAPAKADVTIEDYYFSYNQDALTVNAGQQNIPGRITDGAQGDGIVALYNLGNFTVGAAAFNNHSVTTGALINGGEDVYSVIAMGTAGPVSLLAQYANVKDLVDTYNLKADGSIEMVKLGVEYTESVLNSATGAATAGVRSDRSTLKAYIGAKVGIVSATATYAKTGDNGSGSLHAQGGSFADSVETPSEYLLWQLGSATYADLELYAIDASVAITPSISLRAAYADGEIGTTDVSEALGQISYKVAKNLNTYVRYSNYEEGVNESDRARVEVKYSF